jgi:hypothetical protein
MRPNGLALSRAAPIDQKWVGSEASFQNASDLGAAKRRRFQRLVGRQPIMALIFLVISLSIRIEIKSP